MPNKILTIEEIMKLRNDIEIREALIVALKAANIKIKELEIKNKELQGMMELIK
tara:strand:- start:743 stop:904 length:162 start_codon:yes stop_codon:yes gene_type:complete